MKKQWPKWLVILAFVISTILAGNNAVAVQFSNAEIPPFLGGALRFGVASILLFSLVLILRLPLPRGKAWIGVIVYGVLQFGVSGLLFYWSLLEIAPGMFTILLALSPMVTFILAIIHHQETFQWRTMIGFFISMAGVAFVFRGGLNAQVSLLSLAAVLLGVVSISEGMVLIKAFPESHPITANAIGMGVGTLFLFVTSRFTGELMRMPEQFSTWIALGYLIIFGSIVAFVLALVVVKYWKASLASYQLLLMPFVAIISSSILVNERVSLLVIAGGTLVLLGVYLGIYAPINLIKKIIHPKRSVAAIDDHV